MTPSHVRALASGVRLAKRKEIATEPVVAYGFEACDEDGTVGLKPTSEQLIRLVFKGKRPFCVNAHAGTSHGKKTPAELGFIFPKEGRGPAGLLGIH